MLVSKNTHRIDKITQKKPQLSSLERVIRKNKRIGMSRQMLQPASRVAPFLVQELSDVVTKQKAHMHIAAKKKGKSEEHEEIVREKKPTHSFGYRFNGTTRESYALPVAEPINTYELFYGGDKKRQIISSHYEQGKNSTPEKENDFIVLNPEQANNTIQRIIYGVLFGALSDISIEERERFSAWRQFNKHLRRLYEGGHYFSSITKSV